MDDRYIAAVDLGSSKIALTVALINGNDVEIQYYKEVPSGGIRNSAVFNPKMASAPIKSIIEDAQKELNIKIMQVVVGLPRCDVRTEVNQAEVERSNPEDSITAEEVNNLKNLAQTEYPLADSEREVLYGAVAQSFSDDEDFQLLESDIIGVISRTFEGNFKLFIGKKRAVSTLEKVFNDLGIAIAREYFTPEAIAKAVLTNDEMESGVALVDLGGGATSVTIYKGNIMRHYAAIPFGGKTITSDIKSECTISESLAENIKLAFGACEPYKLQTLEDKIIQIEGDETEGYKQIPVKYLSEIITARAKEIIEAVLWEIQQSGFADDLRSGVVITGGGALLANLPPFIKDLSGYTVRIGTPRHLFSASGYPAAREVSAATSIGMILAAKNDNLMTCIDAPEETPDVQTSEAHAPEVIEVSGEEVSSDTIQGHAAAEQTTPAGGWQNEGRSLPEDAKEGQQGSLFTTEEVPIVEKPKEKKKRPSGFVRWKKRAKDFLNGMAEHVEGIGNEEI